MTLFSSIYTILNKKSFQENNNQHQEQQQHEEEETQTKPTTTTTTTTSEAQVEEEEKKPKRGRKTKIVTNEIEQPQVAAKEMAAIKEEPQQQERVLTRAQRAKLNKLIN